MVCFGSGPLKEVSGLTMISAAVVGLLLHLGVALAVAWVMVMAAITGGSPGAVGEEYGDLVLQYCLFFLLIPYSATLLGDYLQSSSSLPFNILSCAAVALLALWLILHFDVRFKTTLYTRIPHNTHPTSNPSSQPQALLAQHSLFGWSQESVRRWLVVPSLLLALLVPDAGPCRAVLRGCFVVGNGVALWWLYRRRWWR
ncbi:hypothetical protein QOT17_001254 [Balamuthia mandrillaris]